MCNGFTWEDLFVHWCKGEGCCPGGRGTAWKRICDAVHSDLERSRAIYEFVSCLVQRLGAAPTDAVPFDKYAKAAQNLLKPSSAARAVAAGAPFIERVDVLVQLIAKDLGIASPDIDKTVSIVDEQLESNVL